MAYSVANISIPITVLNNGLVFIHGGMSFHLLVYAYLSVYPNNALIVLRYTNILLSVTAMVSEI